MTAVYAQKTQLEALWKETLADTVNNLMPEDTVFVKEIKFEEGNKVGDKFVEPVQVARSNGVTYLGQNSGVMTLKDGRSGSFKEAQIDGYGILIRDTIGYSEAAKMVSSKQAFVKWTTMMVSNLLESCGLRFEISGMWGQMAKGIGEIESVTYAGGAATTATFVVKLAEWADGIWNAMEGATLDVHTAGFGAGSKITATTPLIVTSVDFATRTIGVSGTAADLANLAADQIITFEGVVTAGATPTWYEQPGMYNQAINTTGTMWNISAADWSLWKGNVFPVGSAAVTMTKVLGAVAKPAGRGLREDVDAFVTVGAFNNMNTDNAALRVFDQTYKLDKAESGSRQIVYHGPNGAVRIRPYNIMKNGYFVVLPMKRIKRIGSTDITMQLPGKEGEIFLHLPDKSGYELRAWGEFTFYNSAPNKSVGASGVVNS